MLITFSIDLRIIKKVTKLFKNVNKKVLIDKILKKICQHIINHQKEIQSYNNNH